MITIKSIEQCQDDHLVQEILNKLNSGELSLSSGETTPCSDEDIEHLDAVLNQYYPDEK